MAEAKDVARWMLAKLEEQRGYSLSQEEVVYGIQDTFGEDFLYENENGNLAIQKEVLKEFRKITEGRVVWERGERAWRFLEEGEVYEKRQVD